MSLSAHCQHLLAAEQALFDIEYQRYFIPDESKPSTIGQPYLLHNPAAKRGILLVHGLMAAPEEVRELAEYLYAEGYTVYAPRMAGHGTSAPDLERRSHLEWNDSVKRGYAILRSCCDEIIAAGFSTGAAVMLQQVLKYPQDYRALISISAPVRFSKFSARFARPVHNLNRLLSAVGLAQWGKRFVHNHADNPHINYLRCPVASIAEIQNLMGNVRPRLAQINIPALIMHARHDPKIDIQSARDIRNGLGSVQMDYHEVDFHLHGIIRGQIGQQVFEKIGDFLRRVT